MTITAVIIDDEKNNLINLQRLLEKHCPQVSVIATAQNAEEGKAALTNLRPDLILLDIQMPGINGIEMLQQLPRLDFEVIFVTAYDQYAIAAVKLAALDYLLKPININELQQAIDKAAARIQEKQHNGQLESFLHLLQKQSLKEEHRIALATLKETRLVYPRQIIRCESNNNYCFFHLDTGENLLVSKPIYEYEPLLADYGFIRCHQSHLVNKRYVRSWLKQDGGSLQLENGALIPVSRGKKEEVRKALGF